MRGFSGSAAETEVASATMAAKVSVLLCIVSSEVDYLKTGSCE